MADCEEDDLQMALSMSLQDSPSDAKRIRPQNSAEESPEIRTRRLQRELMAEAAEKRIRAMEQQILKSKPAVSKPKVQVSKQEADVPNPKVGNLKPDVKEEAVREERNVTIDGKIQKEERKRFDVDFDLGEELDPKVMEELFFMLFGRNVSKDILSQWSNQGIRFSSDQETHIGLVQHEGGPCGVLATIQAFVLKYLLFVREESGARRYACTTYATEFDLASVTEDTKKRALVRSMVEILFMCGDNQGAVVATLNVFKHYPEGEYKEEQKKEITDKLLENLSIESAMDFQRVLRVKTYTSREAAFKRIVLELPVYQSRMGALLFLVSALLSRGLESVQADRDDPSLPLVTAPFGHASQEIVNLLLCGKAVPNVFDGNMDICDGMSLKGIPSSTEVGFLTLLEYLNFCKVGQHLKNPKWPIWVVGSESHYTVLFALDTVVQKENESESRESKIRQAFDSQDLSGGGGFISVEGFHHVLKETNIMLPQEKSESLTNSGFIVWSEFWHALLDLDQGLGGFKDSSGLNGKRKFDVYHFNGIAKSVINEGESRRQKPRLCKLSVSVPPKWNQDDYMKDVVPSSSSSDNLMAEIYQHAPLVDCIRTRWPRANCSWVGDAPSIV